MEGPTTVLTLSPQGAAIKLQGNEVGELNIIVQSSHGQKKSRTPSEEAQVVKTK
jgi:hypothetical protein